MCDRLNKGGKLDLSMSSQTGEPLVQQQQQKAVTPLEPLSEMQEEEDETGNSTLTKDYFSWQFQYIVKQIVYENEENHRQAPVVQRIDKSGQGKN